MRYFHIDRLGCYAAEIKKLFFMPETGLDNGRESQAAAVKSNYL